MTRIAADRTKYRPCNLNAFLHVTPLLSVQCPIYVDVYAIPSPSTAADPLSCFRTPFELPVYGDSYADFFKDVARPPRPHVTATRRDPVDVFPRELHFGYAKRAGTVSFRVFNNTESPIFISWIYRGKRATVIVLSPGNHPVDLP